MSFIFSPNLSFLANDQLTVICTTWTHEPTNGHTKYSAHWNFSFSGRAISCASSFIPNAMAQFYKGLDLRSRACQFKSHHRHYVVSLNKTLYHLVKVQPRLYPDMAEIVDYDVKHQLKQTINPHEPSVLFVGH